MNLRQTLACGVAVAALATGSARAATIHLIDLGGVTGSAADQEFHMAAAYWGAMLTNNATINIGVKFNALPAGVIGSTNSSQSDLAVSTWENRVAATKSNSTIDQTAVLPTLTNGGASFVADGVVGGGNPNNTTAVGSEFFDNGATVSSKVLFENTALQKALGLTPTYFSNNPLHLDAQMRFSSTFSFDFDPTDGISAGTFDFLGVAIHEMGHALGFVSGEDLLDYFGYPNGPARGALGYDLNSTSVFTALDMFRYSNDPHDLAPGSGPTLDLTVGTPSYFSIDGGATALFNNSFSTGQFNGDGRQASHWKDAPGCSGQLGIMDPTFCFGQMGEVTGLDVAAFDAMGWNLNVNALGGYDQTTAQIFASNGGIPEPSAWMMSIMGFGLLGATLRRRKLAAVTA